MEQIGYISKVKLTDYSLILQAENREFLLRVSYMEIYNEEINDLLAPENRKLQVHENSEVCMKAVSKDFQRLQALIRVF